MNRSSAISRVALDTVGCKLNQAETQLLARQFAGVGYRLVPADDEAEVYILNTCTVTHVADRKCRQRLRLAHRRNPNGVVVAIGCYAERAHQELAQVEGVDLVLGNAEKSNLLCRLEESGRLARPSYSQVGSAIVDFRTRAFIKVHDGCSSACAYCIVPRVRGGEKSIPVDQVVGEVRQRVSEGYREVVLTGTKVGLYRDDGVNLTGLLKRLLAETDIERLRLSSLQPREVSPELIGLWRDKRLCRHFHLSLQSGSDGVLTRMKRGYTAAVYLGAVALIRDMVPGVAITTDVIVGFPGETDADFEESYELCRQTGFARIHVFPYSPRDGTQAALMPERVGDGVKRERGKRLLALAGESSQGFRQKFLGKTMAVLWEKQAGGVWTGLTDNYIRVYAKSNEDLTNKLLSARLTEIKGDGVWGDVLPGKIGL
jgi:threonylcarbamoyladenosine tRNA methylthiotransferase MtaB